MSIISFILIVIHFLTPLYSGFNSIGFQDTPLSDLQIIEESGQQKPILVNGRLFSVDEINAGIKDTFNCVLYLHGENSTSNWIDSNRNIILNKDVEYELFLIVDPEAKGRSHTNQSLLILVIKNFFHPFTPDGKPRVYVMGIRINEWGVQSTFHTYWGSILEEALEYYKENGLYLGSYIMRIDEIVKPNFEIMDSEWEDCVERELRLYMDENPKTFKDGGNVMVGTLDSGKYTVYVERFFESDIDSYIIFEHENGDIYRGFYYFIHDCSGIISADLNKVRLVEEQDSDYFRDYMEKVRSDPAISFEYTVN